MMILDATTKSLEVVLAGAVTVNQLPFVAGFVDISQANLFTTAVQESDGATNNTTAVTILAAPAASTSRQLRYLSIHNADTASATVTVRLNNNSTLRTSWKGTLAAGDVLLFVADRGFYVLASSGSLKTVASGSAHPLLDGLTNNDTVAGSPTRGDLIVANSTPKWARFSIGSANTVLKSNGTDPSWTQLRWRRMSAERCRRPTAAQGPARWRPTTSCLEMERARCKSSRRARVETC